MIVRLKLKPHGLEKEKIRAHNYASGNGFFSLRSSFGFL